LFARVDDDALAQARDSAMDCPNKMTYQLLELFDAVAVPTFSEIIA
jgi:hypothetical protein